MGTEDSEKWLVVRGLEYLADLYDGRPVWTFEKRSALFWRSDQECRDVLLESARPGWIEAFEKDDSGLIVTVIRVEKGPRLVGPPALKHVRSLLALADRDVSIEVIAQWSLVERAHASRWAWLVHAKASDNIVIVPPEPECVRFATKGDSRLVRRVELARQVLAGGAREPDIFELARSILDPRGHAGGKHA